MHISIWQCDHYSHFDHLDLAILVIFSSPRPDQCARLSELRPAKCPLGADSNVDESSAKYIFIHFLFPEPSQSVNDSRKYGIELFETYFVLLKVRI